MVPYITRNSSIGTDITWEWDYDPLEAEMPFRIATGELEYMCDWRRWRGILLGTKRKRANWKRPNFSSNTCGVSGHKCKDVPTRNKGLWEMTCCFDGIWTSVTPVFYSTTGDVKCWGETMLANLDMVVGTKIRHKQSI